MYSKDELKNLKLEFWESFAWHRIRFEVLQLRTEQIVKCISFLILHFFFTQYNSLILRCNNCLARVNCDRDVLSVIFIISLISLCE